MKNTSTNRAADSPQPTEGQNAAEPNAKRPGRSDPPLVPSLGRRGRFGGRHGGRSQGRSPSVSIPSISIPKEITDSVGEAPKPGAFEGQGMTGAEVFAKLCKDEDLAALFCCPGNYTVINAIAAAGVPAYGGRCEGSMCAAADGFSRATGEVTRLLRH